MNNQRLASLRAKKGYHILPVKSGQMLELHETVGDGNNIRVWKFKGLVIKVKKPNHVDGTFTIRGKAAGQTIEKIYPLSFPKFEKVLLLDTYKIRRAKLYYIRDKVGKDAKMKSIATAEEKGIDLLTLSKEEAATLLAASQASEKADTPTEDVEVKDEEIADLAQDIGGEDTASDNEAATPESTPDEAVTPEAPAAEKEEEKTEEE